VAAKKIHIGTSGWSYKDWKGLYYPEKLKATEWLTFYAKQFDITEINTSFYHLPKPQTVINWAEKVPKKFRFCPKLSRYITHMKKLLEPEEPLQRFFDVFDNIKDRLGPVLVQLPHMVKFDPERTEHFFNILKTAYSDYDFVLEFRHDTWLQDDALRLMERYNIGLVISQSGVGFPYSEIITSKNIYVRFHGPAKLYASPYTDEMLQGFAKKFKKWIKDGHTIWVFFNNDWHGYAINNAEKLKELMEEGG
jgi:uncharacterized protein YecE (DUF72 family)